MKDPVGRLHLAKKDAPSQERLLGVEWLVTNGLGGYAAGTLPGRPTRRQHGLLVAALPAPLGRVVMFAYLSEELYLRGGDAAAELATHLTEFRLDCGLPVWQYQIDGILLEKSLIMPHRRNSVYVGYRLIEGPKRLRLSLLPWLDFRAHDAPASAPLPEPFHVVPSRDRCEVSVAAGLPSLRMMVYGQQPDFASEPKKATQVHYRMEERRGYDCVGDLWNPGRFSVDLLSGQQACLVVSTEPWDVLETSGPEAVGQSERQRRAELLEKATPCTRAGVAVELVLAADQFIVWPAWRTEDAAPPSAADDELPTVIAGYPWFTDWGRDAMISLEGLTLVTGRHREAGQILRMFAKHVRDGLLPNFFPEGTQEAQYNTADATLWFFHALARYLASTGDRATLRFLLPTLHEILDHHFRGTRFGIGVDSADGLLHQGAEGYQLTWMDAKVDGWVVTPRRGKAVEINALWYNALRLMETWVAEEEGAAVARPLAEKAARVRASYNKRFWYVQGGYLYDVVDGPEGDDPSCRPSQIFSFTLDHPVLEQAYWEPVLRAVEAELLTPMGLRSLSPRHPDFKPRYEGDRRARDAAYHQGTVWAWLIGPYVDAFLRVHPEDRPGARALLAPFEVHLDEAGIGSISEIFDAVLPHTPRGCVAQAWSVAEVLRAWVKTADATDRPSI